MNSLFESVALVGAALLRSPWRRAIERRRPSPGSRGWTERTLHVRTTNRVAGVCHIDCELHPVARPYGGPNFSILTRTRSTRFTWTTTATPPAIDFRVQICQFG